VQVKQFCVVEEYETVWQLVSVIEGRSITKESRLGPAGQLGWEVLKKSLPPGKHAPSSSASQI
jgi:para-aminobenzoate synthetase